MLAQTIFITYGFPKKEVDISLAAHRLTEIVYILNCKPISLNMMETFFGLIKYELLYVNDFDSVDSFETELRKYILLYNKKRIKLRLKGMSPAQYRAQYYREFNN